VTVVRLTSEKLAVNGWPVNRLAKHWLLKGRQHADPDYPYILQLALAGLEGGVELLGQGGKYRSELEIAAGRMLSPRLDSAKITRWFTDNPDGPDDPVEQSATLEIALSKAQTWEEAAQVAMEAFFDRIAAENDYYRT
jgi:hypothetical protein